jgi:hypothetical protein
MAGSMRWKDNENNEPNGCYAAFAGIEPEVTITVK